MCFYYEDFVLNLIKIFCFFYDFMGMNFFFIVWDYISGIISMGWDGCVICSRCVNLFEYVEKWCLNLKYLEVKFIDR